MLWAQLGRWIVVLSLLASCLTACNYRDYFQRQSGYDYGSRPDGKDAASDLMHAQKHDSADPKQHDNKQLAYSRELSKLVSAIPGIHSAFVFVTDRNAYVGMMTDLSATGIRESGKHPEEQYHGGTGIYNLYNGVPAKGKLNKDKGVDAEGLYFLDISTADDAYIADNGLPQRIFTGPANSYSTYFTHKETTDISSRLRQTITEKIRSAEPKVQKVFISANREYVNQLAEFAKEAWSGRPLAPLIPEFNRLARFTFAGFSQAPVPLYEQRTGQ